MGSTHPASAFVSVREWQIRQSAATIIRLCKTFERKDTFMIFRQRCACTVMFTVSILIVTGCAYDDRYDEGYDDGLRNGRIEGFERGHEVGYNEGYEAVRPPIVVGPIPSSDPTVTIQDLFVYENIKMTERSAGRSLMFSGEITNKTGVEFSFARFEITLYDANRRILDTNAVFIGSFKAGATRFFEEWIFVPIEDVSHYSIMYVD